MNTTTGNLDRARAYTAKVPGAVQGQGGDVATYRLACVLVNDFALSESEAWSVLAEWNARCLPSWSEAELRSKLQSALRCSHPKPRGNKLDAGRWTPPASTQQASKQQMTPEQKRSRWPELRTPSKTELRRIGEVRNVSPESLRLMIQRGMLFTARYAGMDCWIATDSSRLVAQARRLDGQTFSEGRKALTLPGSFASLPVGLPMVTDFQNILLVEGTGDLLAAFHFIYCEDREGDCHAVAMLGAPHRIMESALPLFAGKTVRVFPHADGEGRQAAARWTLALLPHVASMDGFDVSGCHRITGEAVKDLNDVCFIDPDDFEEHRCLWALCPQ